jgi:hypothetical protein
MMSASGGKSKRAMSAAPAVGWSFMDGDPACRA